MKVLLGLIFLVTVSEGFARKVEIRLESEATVLAGEPIRLSSIVNSSSDQIPETKAIINSEIFPGIRHGEKVKWSRADLAKILSDRFGSDSAAFVIPERVTIEGNASYISHKDVVERIINQAALTCSDCEISIREIKIPNVRANEQIQDWSLDFSRTKMAGSLLVPLKVTNHKGETSNYWVTGFMELFRRAPVARRLMMPGERIEENDYEMNRVNITFLKSSTAREEELKTQVVGHSIPAGQAIMVGDLRKEHSVTKGQLVRVLIGDDGFEVTSQAMAEENGFTGDLVKLKTVDNKKLISGKVIEKGVVRLQ